METKVCNTCKEEKSIDKFSIQAYRNNTPRAKCKLCDSARWRKKLEPVPDLEGEIWKDILDYEGIYVVSNKQRIKRIMHRQNPTNLIINHSINEFDYRFVCLTKNGKGKNFMVSRLVATAFIPNPENKPQVNHLKGKDRNEPEYLEWSTSKENIQHAWETGLSTPKKGEKHSQSKLTEKDVLEIRAIKGMTKRDIAKLYNIGEATVGKIISRKRWTHI